MAAIERALGPLARFNDAACALGKYAGLSLIVLMTAAILLQVFFRYVLGSALTWSEEVARFMLVWMTFLVAPIAYRGGANVALDILMALVYAIMPATFVVMFTVGIELIGRAVRDLIDPARPHGDARAVELAGVE